MAGPLRRRIEPHWRPLVEACISLADAEEDATWKEAVARLKAAMRTWLLKELSTAQRRTYWLRRARPSSSPLLGARLPKAQHRATL